MVKAIASLFGLTDEKVLEVTVCPIGWTCSYRSNLIDGGTLSNVDLGLIPGAHLRIINHGVLDTRNGFEAPFGVIVDVEDGQIN